MNCELPPPESKTTSEPPTGPSPDTAALKARRASSSPGITSISTPQRSRTAATNAGALAAIRIPAVPTAAISSTPSCRASCDHGRDRSGRPLHRLLAERARRVEALAEPRDLGAVDDRAPLAVGAGARRRGT